MVLTLISKLHSFRYYLEISSPTWAALAQKHLFSSLLTLVMVVFSEISVPLTVTIAVLLSSITACTMACVMLYSEAILSRF